MTATDSTDHTVRTPMPRTVHGQLDELLQICPVFDRWTFNIRDERLGIHLLCDSGFDGGDALYFMTKLRQLHISEPIVCLGRIGRVRERLLEKSLDRKLPALFELWLKVMEAKAAKVLVGLTAYPWPGPMDFDDEEFEDMVVADFHSLNDDDETRERGTANLINFRVPIEDSPQPSLVAPVGPKEQTFYLIRTGLPLGEDDYTALFEQACAALEEGCPVALAEIQPGQAGHRVLVRLTTELSSRDRRT